MRTADLSRIFSSHRLTQNYSKHVANQKQQLSGNAGLLEDTVTSTKWMATVSVQVAFLREGAPLYRISSSCQKHSLCATRSQEPFQNLEFIAFCKIKIICLLLSLCKCGHPLPNRLLFNIQKHSGFGASVLWLGIHGNHTQKQLWFPTPSVNEFRSLSREPRANYWLFIEVCLRLLRWGLVNKCLAVLVSSLWVSIHVSPPQKNNVNNLKTGTH